MLRLNDSITYDRYRYEKKIEQISTGKLYLKRSDDASVTDEVARLKNETAKTTQWGENLELAANWEEANGSRVDNILSSVHRVRELAVAANNGSIDPDSLSNMAEELNGLLETLIQDGNVTYVGTPMFSGKGLLPPQPEEWSEISTSTEPYATYTDSTRPYTKFKIDTAMPAGGFKTLNQNDYNDWSTRAISGVPPQIWGANDDPQDYDPGWDAANNRPNPWNPGSEPEPGDLGMPAAGSGVSWGMMNQAQYWAWEADQASLGNAGTPRQYAPGWDAGNNRPFPWNPTEPVAGVDPDMPTGNDWDNLSIGEFLTWVNNTSGGYYYTNPPLSSPPTPGEQADFIAANWDVGSGTTRSWSSFSVEPEPINPYPPSDPGMPSNNDWRYLTKTEYEAWQTENPDAIDPGWYEEVTFNGQVINGHTKQWPSPAAPEPGQTPVAGVYDPNLGMPTTAAVSGGHTWDELTSEEYMDWRAAQEADAGRADFFDPGWDAVNKRPNPWPRPQPSPVAGMNGMPSGHTWSELTEDEFDAWETSNALDGNYLDYAWDGTDNLTLIQPGASGFKDVFFFDSGGKTFTSMFEDPDDPTKVTSVRYNGSESQRTAQMAEKWTDVGYGMVGSGPEGLFIVTGDNPDDADELNVFDSIIRLRDVLEGGDQPSEADLSPIEDIADHIIGSVVDSTVNQKKLESMKEISFNTEVSLENRLSNIEDLDMALAISQMTALESSFQASMQMVQRVNSMQLMNFL